MHFPYIDDLNVGERELIEWQYGILGGFKTHLWAAISCADTFNQERLAIAFPEQVEAYRRFAYEPGYWGALKMLATFGNLSDEERREIEAKEAETRG